MTTWQTDICDTERLTLTALERLFELYKRPVSMETHELAVTFEPAEDALEPVVEDVQAPTHTRVWRGWGISPPTAASITMVAHGAPSAGAIRRHTCLRNRASGLGRSDK